MTISLKPLPPDSPPPPANQCEVRVTEGGRELTTGLLTKYASFRLIVRGHVGVKEIERLIKKVEIDKGILADEGEEATADEKSCKRTELNAPPAFRYPK